MKLINSEENIHVMNAQLDVWSVIRDITSTGNQEDAFYICDIGDIVRKHKTWKSKLPRVQPYYAVKCNDSLTILEVLAALGTCFDCASKNEINKILSLGVNSERIIFANPAKPASHIRYASDVGVQIMTFDNETELHKVKKLYPHAKMVIRIRCDAMDAQCALGMKFGCDPITEAPELLRIARALDIDVIGVSFHVGSGCREPAVFDRAIAASRSMFDYAETLGYQFSLLDLGGGYPGGHGTSIDKIADVINMALDEYFPDPSIRVIAEPGRFYACSAYTLACNIHSVRNVVNKDPVDGADKHHRMYFINDGVYGSFNCILYDHQEVVAQPLYEYPDAKFYSSSIWGPTCDGLDQVLKDASLPDMKVGDWLVFEDMGAYTLPVASPFNGFPIPKVHVIVDENIWMLLKDIVCLSDESFEMIRRPDPIKSSMSLSNEMFALSELGPLEIELPGCTRNMSNDRVLEYINVEAIDINSGM